MDQVSGFFSWFAYPIFLENVSPKTKHLRRLKITWCVFSTIWFIYHYGHLWGVVNVRSIIDFGHEAQHMSIPLGKLVDLMSDFFWAVAVRLYLLVSCFSEPSLLQIIRQLRECYNEFFDDNPLRSSSRKRFVMTVRIILLAHFMSICALTMKLIDWMLDCFEHVTQCGTAHMTPWVDGIGEWNDSFAYSMGTSILPVVASVACLQFAVCVNQLTNSLRCGSCEESGRVTRDIKLVVRLLRSQSVFVKAISGLLFILVSLLSLECVTVVSQLAMRIMEAKTHFMIKVAAEFGYIVLLCYSSSRAVEAKRDLLDQLVQHRIKILIKDPATSPKIRPSCLTVQSLNYLIETIDRTNVELTAAGYYNLNKSFILGLIGTCFTYTLILIHNQ